MLWRIPNCFAFAPESLARRFGCRESKAGALQELWSEIRGSDVRLLVPQGEAVRDFVFPFAHVRKPASSDGGIAIETYAGTSALARTCERSGTRRPVPETPF